MENNNSSGELTTFKVNFWLPKTGHVGHVSLSLWTRNETGDDWFSLWTCNETGDDWFSLRKRYETEDDWFALWKRYETGDDSLSQNSRLYVSFWPSKSANLSENDV